jgi:hypothetical protein
MNWKRAASAAAVAVDHRSPRCSMTRDPKIPSPLPVGSADVLPEVFAEAGKPATSGRGHGAPRRSFG